MPTGLWNGTTGLWSGTAGMWDGQGGLWSGVTGLQQGAGGGAPAVPFASVNTLGWNVEYAATPPSLNPLATFSVSRAGFSDTGTATTITDTLTATQRTRYPYAASPPNQTTLTPLTVALSDYILSTDTVSGATNNSTETMPKPICNWAMLDRQLIGNSLTLEVTGNHWSARSGRPFRCVVFTATDGTNTVTATTTTMTVSGHTGDKNAVLVYQATLDTTILATGLITCNAKVYPWIGSLASGSVADSSASSVAREFSPRYFYKDVSRFAAPPLAYVASAGAVPPGNDTTGVVSTNAVTASALPFLTIQGAIDGLVAATGVTGGYVDGCRVRVKDTVGYGTNPSSPGPSQLCAAVVIERDPNVSKATAILTTAAVWRAWLGGNTLLPPLTEGAVLFRDMTLARTANVNIWQGETTKPLNVMIADDANLDLGGFSASPLSNAPLRFDGCIATNAAGNSTLAAGTSELRMARGLSVNRGGNATEGWLVLGSTITAPGALTYGTRTESGSIVQFNRFLSYASTSVSVWAFGNSTTVSTPVSQGSFSQNLIEAISTSDITPGIRASSDNGLQNLTHVLVDNNTIASGHYQVARMNLFYDDTAASGRTHKFCRVKNTVAGGFYIKEDVFATNGTRVGNWHALYGVGAKNLVTLLVNAGANIVGAAQGPAYPGLGSTIATSQTVQVPATTAWTNWQATTTSGGVAVAGAGGGTYTLPGGSPLLGRVSAADEIFPFDLAGVARTQGAVGALEAFNSTLKFNTVSGSQYLALLFDDL